MRSFSHWMPQYILSKAMDIWYRKRNPDHPWLVPRAIWMLQNLLQTTDEAFEWGSGKSTIWFAERIGKLVSIEHDPAWYQKTSMQLRQKSLINKVDYRLLPVKTAKTPSAQQMDVFGRSRSNRHYADVVEDFPDEHFDFALVDGKIRHICVDKVLPKLRRGGLLILDNSERYIPADAEGTYIKKGQYKIKDRDQWEYLLVRLNSWRTIVTTNGIWQTRFWIKPC